MIAKTFLFLLLTLFLSACGFHLRGYEPLPPSLRVLYVQSSDPYGAFTKQFIVALKKMGIMVVEDPTRASLTLNLISEKLTTQVTSQGASGQMTIYLLTDTVTYELLDAKGRTILPAQIATASRNYSIQSNQILGDLNVQTDLQADMQRDVMNQIFMRLRSHAVQGLLSNAQFTP